MTNTTSSFQKFVTSNTTTFSDVSDDDPSSAATEDQEVKKEENQEANNKFLQFPWKLHQLVDNASNGEDSTIVSWLPCGKAFRIHDKIKFSEQLMGQYFKSSTYKSFHRSLNLWGFVSIRSGASKGVIYNVHFVRGHPEQCYHMKRIKLKRRIVSLEQGTTSPLNPPLVVSPTTRSASDTPPPPSQQQLQHEPSVTQNLGSPQGGSMPWVDSSSSITTSGSNQEVMSHLLTKLDANLKQMRQIFPAGRTPVTLQSLTSYNSPSLVALAGPGGVGGGGSTLTQQQQQQPSVNDFILAATYDILCGRIGTPPRPSVATPSW